VVAEVFRVAQIPALLVYLGKDLLGATETKVVSLGTQAQAAEAALERLVGILLKHQAAHQEVVEQGQHHL
jgi:hypothetical protein